MRMLLQVCILYGIPGLIYAPSAEAVDRDAAVQEFEGLPQKLKDDVRMRFTGAHALEVKRKSALNPIGLLMWDVPYEADRSIELKLSDDLNEKFKVRYSVHGELLMTDSFRIAMDRLPEKVTLALHAWAPGAAWERPAEAKKKSRGTLQL
ncbi:MAG: hypothetical protein M5U26_06735 [Planctomycetota bacterium]|nr:hypothetical protein [Planctomycetota bacterium]